MKKQRMTWLLCSMLVWLVSSCMVEEEMYRGSSYGYSPYVKTGDVSTISRNSAVVKGALDIENLIGYHEYGILWSNNYNSGELEYDGTRTPVMGEGNNPASFQVELTDLNSMTTYYYCTYVELPDGPIYGRVKNFVTLPAETPKLMFPEAFGKDDSGFSVRSAFENWDGQSSFETGFCWKKVGSDYTEPTLESCDRLEYCDSTTPFQTHVDVYWSEASLYAVRAFVRLYATDEIVYSSTLYVSQDDSPLLSPCIVEAIDGNAVSFHAMACNFDGLAITEKGFCYSETSSAPTIEANTKVSDMTSEEITEITATIEGLNPDQFYYVRAYCVADGMTYYGPTYIYGKRDAGIYTLEDLVAFRDARNNNEDVSLWKNEEGVINLYSDIDMGSISKWIPIEDVYLGETFNGNDHVLTNLCITISPVRTEEEAGFFVRNDGTIKNLHIGEGSRLLEETVEEYGTSTIGSICALSGSKSLISNCSSKMVLEWNSEKNTKTIYIGGLVGYNSGIIENCEFAGHVSAQSINAMVGGIVGISNYSTVIRNCVNKGGVGKGYQCSVIGGIVANGMGMNIVACTNEGHVTAHANTEYAGGIAGVCGGADPSYSLIDQCVNSGEIKGGSESVGGIIGKMQGGITNCTNRGIVTTSADMVGSICGNIHTVNNFVNNNNEGTVNGGEGTLIGYDERPPLLSDVTVVSYTATSAVLSARVLDKGGSEIREAKIQYSLQENGSYISKDAMVEGDMITCTLENLTPGTKYFVRAWARNSFNGGGSANFVSFKTFLE